MTITIGTASGNKDIEDIQVGTASGNKEILEIWIGTASGNKLVYSSSESGGGDGGEPGGEVGYSVSPQTATGSAQTPGIATTNTVYVLGVQPGSVLQWRRTSGDTGISILSPNSSSTRFQSAVSVSGELVSGTFVCDVIYNGETLTSETVNVLLTGTSGSGGINA